MTASLSLTRLQMWHLEISRKLRMNKDKINVQRLREDVNLRELCLVLDELLRRRGARGKILRGPLTLWMIDSKVGETTVISPKTQSAITTCRASARRALANPDARWHAQTLPSGEIEIMRMDDGSDHVFGLPRSPIPGRLAGMNVNGRLTIHPTGKTKVLTNNHKVAARELLQNPSAQWRYRTFATGSIEVRRTK